MKHVFKWNDNAELLHFIDDELRATIAAKHVDAYVANYPGVTVPEYK